MSLPIPQDNPLLPTGRFSTAWTRFFQGLSTGGGGSVSSVSVVPSAGISGTVGNPTTTPAITLALGNITPTQVACTGAVTGTNLSGTNTGDQTIGLTGDVTGSGTGSFGATIGAGRVTLAKMANLASNSFIGNNTGAAATPIALTSAQAKALLAIALADVSGMGAGVSVWLSTPTSANLAGAVTDETGSGSLVFAVNPTLVSPVVNGRLYQAQAAPSSIGAAATLTAAQMLGGIIQYTGAAAALTLPTGTLMDAAVVTGLATDESFDVSVVNTGSGAATMTAGVGFTIVGSVTVANATSAQFRCRRSAANTYIAYRIA